MRRALQLARLGEGLTSPNPMVGAVIVHRGLIIGEGYHHRYGGPHAEVNAVRSVTHPEQLYDSTIYVTLEPCSHYGKTPPCAELIINSGIPRVVVGSTDPNERVSGRGIAMLRDAGIEVITGVLNDKCEELNRPFMVAHKLHRPYVMLKWAQSADGFLDCRRDGSHAKPARFSTPLTSQEMHRLRSHFDAILVGSGTVMADNPRLDVRLIAGRSPRRVVLDRRGLIDPGSQVFASDSDTLYFSAAQRKCLNGKAVWHEYTAADDINNLLHALWDEGIQSLMVEGGASVLKAFIDSGLWDDARIEVSSVSFGPRGTARVDMPDGFISACKYDSNVIINVKNTDISLK